MTDFKDIVKKRRSIRKFSDEKISDEDMKLILRAALMSPTSKSSRSWHFYVVDDKQKLAEISKCKSAGADFVAEAQVAVVVLGDADGVTVVPKELIEAVLAKAEEKLEYEKNRRIRIAEYAKAREEGRELPDLAPGWVREMLGR